MFLLSAPRHGPLILKRCKPLLTAEGMTSNEAGTCWDASMKASPGWAQASLLLYGATQSTSAPPLRIWALPAALHPFKISSCQGTTHQAEYWLLCNYHLHPRGFPGWSSSVMDEEVKYWQINQQVSISVLSIIFKAPGNAPSTDTAHIPPSFGWLFIFSSQTHFHYRLRLWLMTRHFRPHKELGM